MLDEIAFQACASSASARGSEFTRGLQRDENRSDSDRHQTDHSLFVHPSPAE
jgi:hypothetical protein